MRNAEKHNKEVNNIREMLDVFAPHHFLNESQVIKLVEERGVWPAPYKKQIEDVINKYVPNQNVERNQIIQIPSQEWGFIKEIEKLDVIITLTMLQLDFYSNYDWGSGKSRVKFEGKLTNDNKLDYGTIFIYGKYLPSGEILKRTIYNNLCHEIHYLLNYHNDLIKLKASNASIKDTDMFDTTINMETIKDWIDNNIGTQNREILKELTYRLFNYTETNAIVSGVYGDLMGMNSRRENFQNDIKHTQAYLIYDFFSKNYNAIIDEIDDSKVVGLYKILSHYGFALSTNVMTPANCKYMIKRSIRHHLHRLFNKIGGAASYYYDSIEETNRINEVKDKFKDGFVTIE